VSVTVAVGSTTTFTATATTAGGTSACSNAIVYRQQPAPVPPTTPSCPAGTSAGVECTTGADGGVVIHGTSGDDVIVGSASADVISGGGGADVIDGGPGADVLKGGGGNDRLAGGAGDDRLTGGGGVDRLVGGDGNDILIGGSPNLFTNDGRDTFQGGKGAGDYADYGFRSDNLTLRLDGIANDGATGEGDQIGNDCEYVIGGRGNDLIVGNSGANFLAGGGGSDVLKGGGGNDQLIANYTKDTRIDNVFGNAGFDYLFLEDRVQDNYNGTLGTDFFRVESNPNTGQPLDVLVPDQT
jgi:Ca2+-binding RTX toxin-like protein